MLPLAAGVAQLALAFRSEPVDPPPWPSPFVVPSFPLRFDESVLFEPIKRRIEGTFSQLQGSVSRVFLPAPDFKSMRFALLEHGENHRLQMPAQRISTDRPHDQHPALFETAM